MIKKITLSLSILVLTLNGSAAIIDDNYKQLYVQAEDLFVNENHTGALPLYLHLDSLAKGNHNVNFKIGVCYLNIATYKTKAIPYLEFAIQNIATLYEQGEIRENKAPISSYYYLGRAYHLNYEFDKATVMYQKYIDALGVDKKYEQEVNDLKHQIETCNYGKELIKNPLKVTIKNLGDGVNTKYPEYSPVISLDEHVLIFTTRREGGASDVKLPNGQYFEDIFVSTYSDKDEKWSKATPIGSNINSRGHEATVNLSADGQKLLIYKNNDGNGDIEISRLNGNEWSTPQYASHPINSVSWESYASFGSDNHVLYFVSDRPGGMGGRDIYKSLRLPNGEWGPAQNLGSTINTKYDEDGIFIHPDGRQIYFASKGHNSMGGFDIFTSTVNDENGNWSEPINYGYPVNTPDDEVFLITSADGKRAFYSSDKEGGYGEKDIYMLNYPEHEQNDITILLGNIINNTQESIENNELFIINTKTSDTVQTLVANSATGKFGANFDLGNTYKLVCVVNGKEIHNEIIAAPKFQGYTVIKREIPFGVPAVASTQANPRVTKAKKNTPVAPPCDAQGISFQIFFKYNKKEIDPSAAEFKSFIDGLTQCLKNNADIKIKIESSASTVPTTKFKNNGQLAAFRAASAKELLLKALMTNEIKKSQIIFSKPEATVQGPAYKKDSLEDMTTYEQFQFVKIKIETK